MNNADYYNSYDNLFTLSKIEAIQRNFYYYFSPYGFFFCLLISSKLLFLYRYLFLIFINQVFLLFLLNISILLSKNYLIIA